MDLVKNATREVVLPVDKMERMDTGLVLFTNDPELADRMRAHGTKFRQLYHVTLRQPVKHEHLAAMVEGVETDHGYIKVSSAELIDGGQAPQGDRRGIHSNRPKALTMLLEHLGYERRTPRPHHSRPAHQERPAPRPLAHVGPRGVEPAPDEPVIEVELQRRVRQPRHHPHLQRKGEHRSDARHCDGVDAEAR